MIISKLSRFFHLESGSRDKVTNSLLICSGDLKSVSMDSSSSSSSSSDRRPESKQVCNFMIFKSQEIGKQRKGIASFTDYIMYKCLIFVLLKQTMAVISIETNGQMNQDTQISTFRFHYFKKYLKYCVNMQDSVQPNVSI